MILAWLCRFKSFAMKYLPSNYCSDLNLLVQFFSADSIQGQQDRIK